MSFIFTFKKDKKAQQHIQNFMNRSLIAKYHFLLLFYTMGC